MNVQFANYLHEHAIHLHVLSFLMRWANYSHSALCCSLRDWFAANFAFLGISWFYCYCCWTFLNCKKCGHIFKGWCAGDLFLFFWALISGRASVVQATRPDLGQKLGEVFGSSLLHGLSHSARFYFPWFFSHHSVWYVQITMSFHGCMSDKISWKQEDAF